MHVFFSTYLFIEGVKRPTDVTFNDGNIFYNAEAT